MKDLASVFIEKSINGKQLNILQIGIVFIKDGKFKFFYKFINNDIKHSNNSIDMSEAIVMIDKILENKKVILKNNEDHDFRILNNAYMTYLNKPFINRVYDISKEANRQGIIRTNIDYLSRAFGADFKNVKELPVSVYRAQKLFVIGTKLFNLETING